MTVCRRSFYANAPLQVSISDEHQLLVKFFSPVGIQDVKIMCRFNKFSMEFFELAHFEQIIRLWKRHSLAGCRFGTDIHYK